MALKSVIDSQNRATGGEPWEVRLVNLQEILDSLDIFRKITGLRLEDVYNKMLAKGWTLGSAQGLQFMHGVIRLYHEPTVRLLTAHWKDTQPDLVVSLVPNFNRAMYQSLRAALPGNNTQGACHQEIGPQQGHSPDLLIVGLAAALSQYA